MSSQRVSRFYVSCRGAAGRSRTSSKWNGARPRALSHEPDLRIHVAREACPRPRHASPPKVSKLGLNPLPARINQTLRLVNGRLPQNPAVRKRGTGSGLSGRLRNRRKSGGAVSIRAVLHPIGSTSRSDLSDRARPASAGVEPSADKQSRPPAQADGRLFSTSAAISSAAGCPSWAARTGGSGAPP